MLSSWAIIVLLLFPAESTPVFAALTEGRQLDWKDIQSIKEIPTKTTVGHGSIQIAIRGREYQYVLANRLATSNAFKFVLLQHA
jgi:hypothetical protein